MGTWGAGIFADDTAADVRDEYRDLLASGVNDEAAVEHLRKKYLDDSPDLRAFIEPVFWIAIAMTQWKLGRLDNATRTKALQVIDSGDDVKRWRELEVSESNVKKRAKVLASVRNKLVSPQGPRKQPRQIRRRISPYKVGDVVRFTLSTDRLVLFRITSIYQDRSGEHPVAEILDYVGTVVPPDIELATLPGRQRTRPNGWASMRFPRMLLPELPKHEFDPDRVAVVSRGFSMPPIVSESFTLTEWTQMEETLEHQFGLK